MPDAQKHSDNTKTNGTAHGIVVCTLHYTKYSLYYGYWKPTEFRCNHQTKYKT